MLKEIYLVVIIDTMLIKALIYPVTIEESEQLLTVFRCDRVESLRWRRKVTSNTLTLQRKSVFERYDYVRNVVKMKCALRVTLNHPYVGTKNANGPR